MYDFLASFAQTGGLLLFVGAFVLVLVYALAPGNRNRFRRAADAPFLPDSPMASRPDGDDEPQSSQESTR